MTSAAKTWFGVADLREHFAHTIGRNRIYALIRSGHLRSQTINGKCAVHRSEVERLDALLLSDAPVLLRANDGSIIIQKAQR